MRDRAEKDAAFSTFVRANGATLLHAARLLTGDHHRAEDLVQAALTKLYLRWGRVDAPLAYTRRVLVTTHLDASRRRWGGERPSEVIPETAVDDGSGRADDRDELRRLLRDLEPRERAVIVLRYYCDLSEQDTATTLRIPLGTVKSTGSRALAKLRVQAGRT
ncbi:MAG: SigE family RNA polymerase sigma factor [Jatrophihabitans sp.]|nr:MAG: SigE family RNA polymerase sigma factor [Jatrophihabitans sp.]